MDQTRRVRDEIQDFQSSVGQHVFEVADELVEGPTGRSNGALRPTERSVVAGVELTDLPEELSARVTS